MSFIAVTFHSVVVMDSRSCITVLLQLKTSELNTSLINWDRLAPPFGAFADGKRLAKSSRRASIAKKSNRY